MKTIRILATGGTFDKEYDELTGRLFFKDTHVPEMLRLGRCRLDVTIETVMMIDSLDLDDAARARIVERARDSEDTAIVVTHGTDTMVQTARALAGAPLGGKDHRLDRRDGTLRVRELGRLVQPRVRAVVRSGAAARCVHRHERSALSLECGAEEHRNRML